MMSKSRSIAAALVTGLAFAPAGLYAQRVDRVGAQEILVEALRYMIEVEFESKFSDPVLVGARLSPGLADSIGIESSGIEEAVGQALGIPIQGYRVDTFCDMNRHTPYLRSLHAGLLRPPSRRRTSPPSSQQGSSTS